MSLPFAKLIGRPLALAAASLVIHIGAAAAADSAGGSQQQIQEVLTGTIPTHSTHASEPRDDKGTRSTAGAQELVKGLLLGSSRSAIEGTQSIQPSRSPGASGELEYTDLQTAVRQFVLGQRHTPGAS